MKRENSEKQFPNWSGQYPAFSVAVIILIVLSISSCSTRKQTIQSREIRFDSLRISGIRRETFAPVPQSQAELKLNLMNLRSLPDGAGYNQRSGQASLNIRKEGDSIRVTATCDSLERQITILEEELIQASRRLETENTITLCQPTWEQTFWIWTGKMLTALFAARYLYTLFKNLLKRIKQRLYG